MQKVIRQVVWFIVVGCAAAATHWGVAVLAVSVGKLQPLVANVLGWLTAFGVSFLGHYQLTFKLEQAPVFAAARRFFAVSALGFAVNELAYAWLLRTTTLRYDVLLALILMVMAVLTFTLSRYWAFRHTN